MKCKFCREGLNNGATRCHHCKSWQSTTGAISKASERSISISLLAFILILSGYVIKGKLDIQLQQRFQELDKTARFIALEEIADKRISDLKRFGDNDVDIFNYWALKSRTGEISNIVKNGIIPLIYKCMSSEGSACGSIEYNKTINVSTVYFEAQLSEIEKVYLMHMLANLRGWNDIRVSNGFVAVAMKSSS